MGPSTSSDVRLRGKYVQAAPDRIQHMSLLQNKFSLTKPQKKYYSLPMTTTFKFHYESREQLLEDYLEYMPKKSSAQYIRHQRRTAHSVDKSMCLFPNALKEHDMVE